MSKNQYYALKASLPMLSFDAVPQITVPHFLDYCELYLTPEQLDFLRNLSLKNRSVPEASTSVSMHRYAIWEICLRNTLTELRAAKLNLDAGASTEHFAEYETTAAAAARTVFSMQSDPLEKERILDRFRWDFLDSMEWEHIFDFEALCIYLCKLLILEKWTARQTSSAAANLESAADYSEKLFNNKHIEQE